MKFSYIYILLLVSFFSIINTGTMNNKHRSIAEGSGSRVTFSLNGITADFHRPHPSKEAKRYQIADTREFLSKAGIDPAKV